MTAAQMVVLAGDAGVGKSLLALYWAQALACGLPIFDERSASINVLYINEENSWYDMREYIRWVRYGMEGIDEALLDKHLRVEQFTLSLSESKWFDDLRVLSVRFKPKLIVIDTATPACQIQDEDKNGEASVAIGHLRAAMAAGGLGCGMLVLKHSRVLNKKGESRTIRGAKAWKGSCDSLIFHTRSPGRPRDDGLHLSFLWPDKARAFGLKERVKIVPSWVYPAPSKKGISLSFYMSQEE